MDFTWQINLLLSMICGVIFFQCYKLAVAKAKNDAAATIIIQVIAGATMISMIPFSRIYFPDNPYPFILLLIACFFYAISDRLQTTVRKHLEVSTFAILGQLSNVFLILFGFLFFKEPFLINKIAGAILIIGGNILLQYRGKKIDLGRYINLAILGALSLATAISIDIGNSDTMTLPIYIAITFLVPALMLFIGERIPIYRVKQEIQHLNIKYTLITGFSWAGTIYFLLRAYQGGSMSTIVSLQATSVLWNVIIAYFLLKERNRLPQKIAASILVILGIIATIS